MAPTLSPSAAAVVDASNTQRSGEVRSDGLCSAYLPKSEKPVAAAESLKKKKKQEKGAGAISRAISALSGISVSVYIRFDWPATR